MDPRTFVAVVMDIALKTGTSPSRLLMPMAYASLLGGLTTLVGTPPNLVASGALRQAGREGFTLSGFAPIGVPELFLGAIFIALIGRHLLPSEMPQSMKPVPSSGKLQLSYALAYRRFEVQVGAASPLHNRPLRNVAFARSLCLTVLDIHRGSELIRDPDGSAPYPARRPSKRPGPAG